jgi:putative nucleotidyltransferase with HDIG domain
MKTAVLIRSARHVQERRLRDMWDGGYVTPMWPYVRCAERLSGELLADAGRRWLHVQEVASKAEELSTHLGLEERDLVVSSAWLHDIGYADPVALTGLHSLDGARYLQDLGCPEIVVGLVAYHTASTFEAAERGLLAQLSRFAAPPGHLLDILTTADLSVGPAGNRMDPEDRIAEILQRYEPGHPVNRAVLSSRESLLSSVERARACRESVRCDLRSQPT